MFALVELPPLFKLEGDLISNGLFSLVDSLRSQAVSFSALMVSNVVRLLIVMVPFACETMKQSRFESI